MKVLVTGGCGYIGSHTVLLLIEQGIEVVVFDNLCNSSQEVLLRIERLSGQFIPFVKGDIRDAEALRKVFIDFEFNSVIHFAGLKAVGESFDNPLGYYGNNIVGTINLLRIMAEYDCKYLVFSSSAAVYGDPSSVPVREDFPLSATNPYGNSKLILEEILRDLSISDSSWSIGVLRYFNPLGAHFSGLIGEDPSGTPNNLMPFITQVAVGIREKLLIFGADYSTPDGTGIRDYIHVVDLANGHLKALLKLQSTSGMFTVNLGTGQGYSVLDVVNEFESVCGKSIPYEIVGRRPGDISQCFADPQRAIDVLGWSAERGLKQMCEDAWRWQSQNPNGYDQ